MNDAILDQAIRWHAAQQEDDCDWEAFALWLEADPAHRRAYDDIALTDAALDRQREALATILPAPDDRGELAAGPRRRYWLGAGLAAAVAMLFFATQMMLGGGPGQEIFRTGPGETRLVELEDGSSIRLAALSELTVGGGKQDELALSGKGYFDIVHDPDRPMRIVAGDQVVSDIGTRFDILADGTRTRIAVEEGTVSVRSPSLDPVRLVAGQQLIVDPGASTAAVSRVDQGDVGSWRTGTLVYDAVPLALVAADISRYAGERVTVAPDIAGRPFSGALTIGDGSRLVGDIAELMDLRRTRRDGAVVLERAGAP